MAQSKQVHMVIIGGGPGGYEAALSAARLGAKVILIERQGVGGSAVLTDVVPSKTLIADSERIERVRVAQSLGLVSRDVECGKESVDLAQVNKKLAELAASQSADIAQALEAAGVTVIDGEGKIVDSHTVEVNGNEITADYILVAVGGSPRELDSSKPDGKRIFNWTQLYGMREVPEHLIVIGSGVTGAEFASAYIGLGSKVTLVSSRDQVLPGEDEDAARVLEKTLQDKGLNLLSRSRAESVEATDDGVIVTLTDGKKVEGTQCLVAVGSVPNTAGIGLEEVGVELKDSGHIEVDSVCRTTVPNIYAVGDCNGVFPLASVAAMQGRLAVAHMLGDVSKPLKLKTVAANIFTTPEIASVGIGEQAIKDGEVQADISVLPIMRNPRAKMLGLREGFVKLFAQKGSGIVLGGVIVGPGASELIFPVTIAVTKRMTVDDLAETFTVYPSVSGTITEAARRLHTIE